MVYMMWGIVALLALTGLVLLLFVPGVGVLAALALVAALLMGIVALISRGADAAPGSQTPDVLERRDEFRERQHSRRRRAR